MSDRLITLEYQDGWDAYAGGLPLEECPYPPATRDSRDWRQGWRSAEFSERVITMEAEYAA